MESVSEMARVERVARLNEGEGRRGSARVGEGERGSVRVGEGGRVSS